MDYRLKIFLLGITLIQHILDMHENDINHEQPRPKCVSTHDIIIEDSTLLSELTKKQGI